MSNDKVVWSEGLLLRPQFFQQQERYFEHYIHARTTPLSAFFWGFSQITIDTSVLDTGKLVVSHATGTLKDGTPFETDGQLPAFSLLPEHINELIYLVAPIRTPNAEETLLDEDESANLHSMTRYAVRHVELRDTNVSKGMNLGSPQSAQLSKIRLGLRSAKNLSAGWTQLPIARVRSIRANGSAELDPTFIPPLLSYGTSNISKVLYDEVANVCSTLKQQADSLGKLLVGEGGRARASAEVQDYLMLQTLNQFQPVLEHLIATKSSHPEQVYLALAQLVGNLSTLKEISTRRPQNMPVYQHDDIYQTLNPLTTKLANLLTSNYIPSEPLSIKMVAHGNWVIEKPFSALQAFSSIIIEATSDVPASKFAPAFLAQIKLAPETKLQNLIQAHLPGIPLTLLNVPPRQITINPNASYFKVEIENTFWERMNADEQLVLYVGGQFKALKIVVLGIHA